MTVKLLKYAEGGRKLTGRLIKQRFKAMTKKIYTEEEARLRKNERQREYAKRTGYAANAKYLKEKTRRYIVQCVINTEQDIIQKLDSVDNKSGYIKSLIRKDIENE